MLLEVLLEIAWEQTCTTLYRTFLQAASVLSQVMTKSAVKAKSAESYNRCATERKRSFWTVLLSWYKDMRHPVSSVKILISPGYMFFCWRWAADRTGILGRIFKVMEKLKTKTL